MGHLNDLFSKAASSCQTQKMTKNKGNKQGSQNIKKGNHQPIDHQILGLNFFCKKGCRHRHHVACDQFTTSHQNNDQPNRKGTSTQNARTSTKGLQSTSCNPNIQ